MKQKTILAAMLLCFSTVPLAAAPAWLADFNKADLNDSGGLSKLELGKTSSRQLDALRTHFESIDVDKDGHVTDAEYEAWQARNAARLSEKQFVRADLNDSGGLSLVEIDKSSDRALDTLRQNFDRIDRDRDGHLTYAEYTAYADASGAAHVIPPAPPIQHPQTHSNDQCQPNCGMVQMVDYYRVKGEGSALGTIAGGVAGAVLGNQVGGGTGKKIATVGGAAGGAYLGHRLEAQLKTKKMIRVIVRFDNGEQRDFDFEGETSPVAVGDRVQIVEGKPAKYVGR